MIERDASKSTTINIKNYVAVVGFASLTRMNYCPDKGVEGE